MAGCIVTARFSASQSGNHGTHGTGPATRKLPYDAVKDFTPIGMIGATPNVLAINDAVPAKTVKEFVALARAKPGHFTA